MAVIALISPGAMGSAVAARLIAAGHTVLTSLDGRSPATLDRAAKAGMKDAPDDELAGCDIFLSIVPPAEAAPLAERFMPLFRASARTPLYVDANALNPESKKTLAARLAETGVDMVDGAIIGPPPTGSARAATTIFLSGPRAQDAAVLDAPGCGATVLEGDVGAASALKMCYGGINKGTIGLTTALLLAAERHGAAGDLVAEFAISQKALLERSRRQIPEMYPKAWRWDPEMEEVAAFLEQDDPAAAAIWRALARFYAERAVANDAESELPKLKALLTLTP